MGGLRGFQFFIRQKYPFTFPKFTFKSSLTPVHSPLSFLSPKFCCDSTVSTIRPSFAGPSPESIKSLSSSKGMWKLEFVPQAFKNFRAFYYTFPVLIFIFFTFQNLQVLILFAVVGGGVVVYLHIWTTSWSKFHSFFSKLDPLIWFSLVFAFWCWSATMDCSPFVILLD